MKKRLDYFDIAKAIGIVLVVWAHTRGPLSQPINQFHMPLFFIISGYLYSSSSQSVGIYVKRKVKTLYIPFIVVNMIFIIVRIFGEVRAGSISDDHLHSYIKMIIETFLTLRKDGRFFGATWFLGALFLVTILFKTLDYYLGDIKYKSYILLLMWICIAIIGFETKLPYFLNRTLVLSMFYAIGYVVKIHMEELNKINGKIVFIFSIVLFALICKNNYVNLGANEFRSIPLFIIGALFASYVIMYISYKIDCCFPNKVKTCIKYIGKHSLDIVIWQYVVFRIVIAFQLYINQISLKSILEYYPVFDSSGKWWMVYLIVGVMGSLIVGAFARSVKNGVKRVIEK